MASSFETTILKVLFFCATIGSSLSAADRYSFCLDDVRYITNISTECKLEGLVNNQIQKELNAFYNYMQMGYYFAHEDYNLPYFSKFFIASAHEELKHAEKLMEYQVLRGGHVTLKQIASPTIPKKFSSGLEALNEAFKMEKQITNDLHKLFTIADQIRDIHLTDYLESEMIKEQYESMKKLKNMIGTLQRMSKCSEVSGCYSKLGEFQFDKLVMKDMNP